MIWGLITGFGSLTFIINGFSLFGCESVDFSGGRIINATCYDSAMGTMSGTAGGFLFLLGGIILGIIALASFSKR